MGLDVWRVNGNYLLLLEGLKMDTVTGFDPLNVTGKYILKNKKPVAETNLFKWGRWFEKTKRRVIKQKYIGKVFVSTVFLGLDHRFGMSGDPILFETMIFGGKHDEYQERYTTYEGALKGHKKAVQLVKKEGS